MAFIGFHQELARGDLFTVLGLLKNHELGFDLDLFRVVIVMIVSFYLAKDISKLNDRMLILSLLLIGSLLTFPHLMYDFLVLLPTFVYSFSNRKLIHAKFSLLIILYFWFGNRLLDYFMYYITNKTIILSPISYVGKTQVVINFVLLIFLYYSNKKIKDN